LITNATKPDVSDILLQAWVYVAISISLFWLRMGWKMLTSKASSFHLILIHKVGMLNQSCILSNPGN